MLLFAIHKNILHTPINNNKKYKHESHLQASSPKTVPDPDKQHAIKQTRSEQESDF